MYTCQEALSMDRRGGIHPDRENITDNGIPSSTLILLIQICGPYAADYGGEKNDAVSSIL